MTKQKLHSPGLRWSLVVFGLFSAILFGVPAQAHKVNLFSYVDGDQVYVQGYFPDGKKAKNSTVTVYGPDGTVLVEGTTNEKGEYTFPTPAQKQVKIVLNAGLGHRAEYVLAIAPSDDTPAIGDAGLATKEAPGGADAVSGSASAPAAVDTAKLEAIVHKAVAQGMLPIARELDELKDKTSLDRVIGGIGLILALVGGAAYFKAKKMSQPPQ